MGHFVRGAAGVIIASALCSASSDREVTANWAVEFTICSFIAALTGNCPERAAMNRRAPADRIRERIAQFTESKRARASQTIESEL